MDGCIITAGMSFYGFSRAGNVNVRHVHHDPSQCWLVRRSFASEHYVRGFKPQHNRFSLRGTWLESSLYRQSMARGSIHPDDL